VLLGKLRLCLLLSEIVVVVVLHQVLVFCSCSLTGLLNSIGEVGSMQTSVVVEGSGGDCWPGMNIIACLVSGIDFV